MLRASVRVRFTFKARIRFPFIIRYSCKVKSTVRVRVRFCQSKD